MTRRWRLARGTGPTGIVVSIDEVPDEPLLQGDVSIEMILGGICGTDIGILHSDNELSPGMPMHEVVGRVVESRSRGLVPGDFVVGWAVDYDALQTRVKCRGDQLARVPEALRDDLSRAVIAQPLACVRAALEKTGELRGKRVAVLGLGSIGALFAEVLLERGARVCGIDVVDRSAWASELGIEFVRHDVAEGALPRHRERFDLVIEAIGHDAEIQARAFEYVAQNGACYLFGVPDDDECVIPLASIFFRNISIHTGVTTDHRRHLNDALKQLASTDIAREYISDEFTTVHLSAAFARAERTDSERRKVIVRFSPSHL